MAAITLERLEKTFPNGHHAVRAVDLAVARGEFLVLVGPSGCGKSTLLRLIAGLELPTAGRILIGDRDVTAEPPQARDLAMVFQSYALYPHMSVRENLSYGLRVRGTAAADIAASVNAAAEALELTPLLDRRPAQLSGGQRQRVALGRAMVREPNAFLFDEPLSNLDPALRLQARAELLRLHRRLQTTMVYVTHDQEEAMTLAGRVAVMRDGRIEQVAPPMEIYTRPANVFVAQFIGAPAMNLLRAPVPGVEAADGTVVGVRPQDVVIDGEGRIEAQVDLVEPRGHDVLVHLRPDGGVAEQLLMIVAPGAAPAVQSRVGVGWRPEAVHLFEPATGRRLG